MPVYASNLFTVIRTVSREELLLQKRSNAASVASCGPTLGEYRHGAQKQQQCVENSYVVVSSSSASDEYKSIGSVLYKALKSNC